MNADELRAALEAHPETIHAGAPRSPSDLYCLARIDDVVELVCPPDGGVTSTPTPGPPCEECAFLRNQVDELQSDVLTAWRVRNASLKVAASFVLPGPDGQDYIDRERLVREWVDDGHDEVAADDAQRHALMREVIGLRLPAGEWRVSVGVDGTRTVTPLRRVTEAHEELLQFEVFTGTCSLNLPPRVAVWADAPENGDPTDA